MLKEKNIDEGGEVQKFIDSEVIRLMSPYTPKREGNLINSVTRLTTIGSGIVKQGGSEAPYAVKWYNNDANFNGKPVRGKGWFEQMKRNGGKETILKGVRRLTRK